MKLSLSTFFIALTTTSAVVVNAAANNDKNNAERQTLSYSVPYTYQTEKFGSETETGKKYGIDGAHCKNPYVVSGMACFEHKCHEMQLECTVAESYHFTGIKYLTLGFSEEEGYHDCPPDYALTGMKCGDRFCDTMYLECSEMDLDWYHYSSQCGYESMKIEREQGFKGIANNENYDYPLIVPNGLRCEGAFCEFKYLRYCEYYQAIE